MPLGLLKWTVLWFSATLSEDQFKCILDVIKGESPMKKKYFSSLLREWLRMGYLGKESPDNFRKDLQEASGMGQHFLSRQFRNNLQESFGTRSQFITEQMKEVIKFSEMASEVQAINRFNTMEMEVNTTLSTMEEILNPSSSFSSTIEKLEASCSGKINVRMFFPGMRRNKVPVPKYPVKYGNGNNLSTLELGLEDHLFFFHKALLKDLEDIVLLSSKLSNETQLFPYFQQRFQQLQLLYDIHSETEDKVLFPYLESKGKLKNITHSYSIDHKMENEHFKKISLIINEISKMHDDPETFGQRRTSFRHIYLVLHETCLSMKRIISDHFTREEIDLGPLFGEHFSSVEQYKIIGDMLGRTRGETLQEMIPWLMSCLTHDEQHAIMNLWRKATKSTNFDEWLAEWWKGIKVFASSKNDEGSSFRSSMAFDSLEIISKYLYNNSSRTEGNWQHEGSELSEKKCDDYDCEKPQSLNLNKTQDSGCDQNCYEQQGLANVSEEPKKENCYAKLNCIDLDEANQKDAICEKDHSLVLSQKELETVIRRISRDSTLDSQKKSHLIQSLLVSRWMVTQQKSNMTCAATKGQEEDIGKFPSYQDPLKLTFGCKHYRRNCKILAPCCEKLYTCIRCHDELTDHSIDRKAITMMLCMKCLVIQPIGPKCSTLSCNNFSMGRYFCKICKLWDDERQIYHCPYCNLCRVGKGLGIDYFHCMNCNACMARSLSVHICREKCFEDNCPICHEYIFTSSAPVKALPCGHLMHSACFQEYTCGNYTCPICSKSLGDMQVYFQMLDALLADEKIPEEYLGQTQVILCNDCERRGTAAFHWSYHKCPYCGSYNTRLL